jgi:hypothetical protein
MKIAILAALVGAAAAFAPAATLSRTSCLSRPLAAVEAAAKSAEEDLELTLKVIMSTMTDDGSGVDDSDVEDESPPAPPVAAVPAASSVGVELWSVGYDDTVNMAYAAAGSSGDFGAFKSKYLEETSAAVAKKGLL